MSTTDKPLAVPRPGKVRVTSPAKMAKEAAGARPKTRVIKVKAIEHGLVMQVAGVRRYDHVTILGNIKKGLKARSLSILEEGLDVSQKELSGLLAIPTSTLTRRRKQGRLKPEESDRVVRFARLKDSAVQTMAGDKDAATQWLNTPLEILGGETPLGHASTELGARDVEDLLGRIRHGVFS